MWEPEYFLLAHSRQALSSYYSDILAAICRATHNTLLSLKGTILFFFYFKITKTFHNIDYFVLKVESSSMVSVHITHSKLETLEELSSLRANDLKSRIEEMLRIKMSVGTELRELEAKRQRLQVEVSGLSQRIEELKQELLHQETELDRLKISVMQAQVAQREAVERNTPELALPKRILADAPPEILPKPSSQLSASCRMYNCFDHSRCALTSGFPVYLYDPDQFNVLNPGWDVDGFLGTTIKQTLGNFHLYYCFQNFYNY